MGNKFINEGLEGIKFVEKKNKLPPQKMDKYHLSMAGGYRVCAELLSHLEMANEQGIRNNKKILPYQKHTELAPNGVDNVLIDHLAAYENQWQKIIDSCSK
jgi:hypothetical protein